MKVLSKYLFVLVALFSRINVDAQEAKHEPFRIIGYLRTHNILNGTASQVDYSNVTHINVAFINPDSTGNFESLPGLKAFADKMHSLHIKVLASIGGGLAPEYYVDLLNDKNRDGFTKKLAALTSLYDLDGIDVDLEGKRIDDNYESFIVELSAALKSQNKLLTAAVATTYKKRYTDKALALFDFISVMSYDKTGPWKPKKPGPHSPYKMAKKNLRYWTYEKHIPKEKLNLGIPFYGYGFGPNAPEAMSFREIIKSYDGAEVIDQVGVTGGGTIYYNGIPTIKSKVELALAKSGGIMIWELMQDAQGDLSLLKIVNSTVNSKK